VQLYLKKSQKNKQPLFQLTALGVSGLSFSLRDMPAKFQYITRAKKKDENAPPTTQEKWLSITFPS
jgi:hypothetical protein